MKKRIILNALEALKKAESKTFVHERLEAAMNALEDGGFCQLHIFDSKGNSVYTTEIPRRRILAACDILRAISNENLREQERDIEKCAELLTLEDDDDAAE